MPAAEAPYRRVQLEVQLCRRGQLAASLRARVQAEQAAAVFRSHTATLAYDSAPRQQADWSVTGAEYRHGNVAGGGAGASAEPTASPFGAQLASVGPWLPAGACPALPCSAALGLTRESRQRVEKRKCYHPLFIKRGTESEND